MPALLVAQGGVEPHRLPDSDESRVASGFFFFRKVPMLRLFVSLGMAFLLAACGDPFPDYNYKMTIYANGKAFSSVRHVEEEEVFSLADSGGRNVSRSLEGEAVIIDHPNGTTYYALLGKPNDPDYATLVSGLALRDHVNEEPKTKVEAELERRAATEPQTDSRAWLDDMAERSRALNEVKGPRDLPRWVARSNSGQPPYDAWPMFVTFSDPRDPRTVREVSPESIGVSRITIEITDEDVTEGIEGRLGWLPDYYNKMLDGKRLNESADLANNLTPRAFRREEKR